MRSTLDRNGLLRYLDNQIKNIFNDGEDCNIDINDISNAIERMEYCLMNIRLKYFYDEGPVFDHLYGDAYSMFLYLVSREMYLRGNSRGATKVFLLNKMMFGIDVYFTTVLPGIFYFSHSQGTVLGNAKYSDFLVVYQGVNIGSDLGKNGTGGKYPSFGKGLVLLANTTIVGDCEIGDNVTFGAHSFLRNKKIESNTIVVGHWPNNRFIPNKYNNSKYYFGM